jgi:hypothetical protein
VRSSCTGVLTAVPILVDLNASAVDLVERNVFGRKIIIVDREVLFVPVDRRLGARVARNCISLLVWVHESSAR